MVKKFINEYSLIKKNALDKIEELCIKTSSPIAISILYISNVYVVCDIMGTSFLNNMKDLLISDITSIPNDDVYAIEELSDNRFLLVHSLHNKEVFARNLSSIFMNFRKHEMIRDSNISISYKCGTAMIGSQGIHYAYNQAFLAFSKAFTQEYYKHIFIDEAESILDSLNNEMKLGAYFQDAINDKRLSLAFQPVINTKNGKISGHECLLRLVTPQNNIISAGPFIPVAEKMGFIDVVDELVLEMVASELNLSPSVYLGMNVSSASIDNKNWLDKAKTLLKDPDLASRLIIEITETSAQRDLKKLAYFVDFIQGLGAQIAIDDFGSGYTSFKQLQSLRADIIKIDGLFIKDIASNHDNRFFVQMMLDCSKTFNMKTTAEFVENGEIAKVLMGLDVDYMQGNYFGPAVNYRSWIKDDLPK